MIPGDEQSHHHSLHSQNQHQRPPSEHIYFSIESDYNSTLATASNVGNDITNSPANLNTNSIHRPAMATQQWRLTGTHKNSAQQPYMV